GALTAASRAPGHPLAGRATHPEIRPIMNPCPRRAQLRQLVAEELQGPEALALEAHVETCAACQRVLEELVGALPLPEDRASASSDLPTLDEEFVADLVRHLEQAPHAVGVET